MPTAFLFLNGKGKGRPFPCALTQCLHVSSTLGPDTCGLGPLGLCWRRQSPRRPLPTVGSEGSDRATGSAPRSPGLDSAGRSCPRSAWLPLPVARGSLLPGGARSELRGPRGAGAAVCHGHGSGPRWSSVRGRGLGATPTKGGAGRCGRGQEPSGPLRLWSRREGALDPLEGGFPREGTEGTVLPLPRPLAPAPLPPCLGPAGQPCSGEASACLSSIKKKKKEESIRMP